MDFRKLLSVADRNKDEARYQASIKQYSTECGPAKKVPKSNVQSSAIKQFLAKRQAEEVQKAMEAKQKREELLSIRAQNSKNNKKAKIMASRTKDNDFSRIRLTDDEVEAKKKREAELIRLSLNDTVQRMKARINLEEQEKLLPKKRKRKSKHADGTEEPDHNEDLPNSKSNPVTTKLPINSLQKGNFKIPKTNVKRPPPPTQSLSFHDLLKVAQQKQHEPVVIQKKVKTEERPLTKKEKLQRIEEENRRKRKLGLPVDLPAKQKGKNSTTSSSANGEKEQIPAKQNSNSACSSSQQPTVIHIQKDSKSLNNRPNQADTVPKGGARKIESQNKNVASSSGIQNGLKSKVPPASSKSTAPPKSVKQNNPSGSFNKNKTPGKCKESSQETKAKKTTEAPTKKPMQLDENFLAEIENRLRAKIQEEIEAKFKMSNITPPVPSEKKPTEPESAFRTSDKAKLIKSNCPKPPIVNNKPPQSSNLPPGVTKKPMPLARIPPSKPPPPKKPAFHPNPYLQPPRRLLEAPKPQKRPRYRLESDEEDDEMSDFIDDGDMNGLEQDVSGYIKEIFGYDRSRFANEDDLDDVLESSFDHQMREEKLSARLGYLEDLDDIKKEKEEEKRRKMKAKSKKKK